ncbi:hypothetical protein BD1_59 [Octadecabacter Antarctic BD virus 1]|nr:hypothetical protein BD1_59 [Octadecabacter Antarctic BD virus 1]
MDNGKIPSNYPSEVRGGAIHERVERITYLFTLAFDAHQRARGLADRILGAEPVPSEASGENKAEPRSALQQLDVALDGLEREVRETYSQIERLEII